MSNINCINNSEEARELPNFSNRAPALGAPANSNSDAPVPAFLVAYLAICEAVRTGNEGAQVEVKRLENNTETQNKLLREEAKHCFFTIPPDVLVRKIGSWHAHAVIINGSLITWRTANYVEVLQAPSDMAIRKAEQANLGISADRSLLENKVSLLRQGAQLDQTTINSTADETRQTIQEGGNFMEAFITLTNRISAI